MRVIAGGNSLHGVDDPEDDEDEADPFLFLIPKGLGNRLIGKVGLHGVMGSGSITTSISSSGSISSGKERVVELEDIVETGDEAVMAERGDDAARCISGLILVGVTSEYCNPASSRSISTSGAGSSLIEMLWLAASRSTSAAVKDRPRCRSEVGRRRCVGGMLMLKVGLRAVF